MVLHSEQTPGDKSFVKYIKRSIIKKKVCSKHPPTQSTFKFEDVASVEKETLWLISPLADETWLNEGVANDS